MNRFFSRFGSMTLLKEAAAMISDVKTVMNTMRM